MNRRSLTQGLAAALLPGFVPACAQRRNVRAFYACEMDIEVDGRACTLKNGGEHRIWEGSATGNALTTHHWYPFAATMQLPTGEILAAIPPSPEGGIRKAFRAGSLAKNGGESDGNTDLPSAFLPYLDISYPKTAVPLVYIFDRGADSRYAEGYSMRAALLDGDTRVTARGLRIKRAAKDVRASGAALIPWLKPLEEIAPRLASVPPGQGVNGASSVLRMDGAVIGAPMLSAYHILLEGETGDKSFSNASRNYNSLNSELAARLTATVWVQPEQKNNVAGMSFVCASDPRVAIFRSDWKNGDRKPDWWHGGDKLSIAGVPFELNDRGIVLTADGATKLLAGSRLLLGNLLSGVPLGVGRGDWHAGLSPSEAGFASVRGMEK